MEIEGKFTRRDFLKMTAAGTLALLFNPEKVKANTEKPYVAQKTLESCGYACMAMIVAERKNEDPEIVLDRISDYYKTICKYDLRLGRSALKDYFERMENISVAGDRKQWTHATLGDQLHRNGSTIVDVTSNYVNRDLENPANHWVIVDDIVHSESDSYALVRDPLRSTQEFGAKKDLTSDMIPANNGSIYIPINRFVSSLGKNFLYPNNASDEKVINNASIEKIVAHQ